MRSNATSGRNALSSGRHPNPICTYEPRLTTGSYVAARMRNFRIHGDATRETMPRLLVWSANLASLFHAWIRARIFHGRQASVLARPELQQSGRYRGIPVVTLRWGTAGTALHSRCSRRRSYRRQFAVYATRMPVFSDSDDLWRPECSLGKPSQLVTDGAPVFSRAFRRCAPRGSIGRTSVILF